ncbi:hypothetical protein [Mobiluncus mulieris]|uniref:hypothetical protein n=1 Tax=Mobiluncus mulieris TaxID=2052 RepID=UPI000E04C4BF|nr:hypothetical protein [Mobiluncus mulieris]STY84707.1 Uncharacterised protein [Mobiluncus mulieris]
MEALPEKLAADIQTADGSTPLADLVRLAVALAQARDTGHDTFQAALKLKNLITPHEGEDPLKTLVGLKQCKTAGIASGGGVLSTIRGLDGDALEAWLAKPENLAGFAEGMEDVAAVLHSPGIIHALGKLVAGWKTAIGQAPEKITEYSPMVESHRRIAEAYNGLTTPEGNTTDWGDPWQSHAGLVSVMAAVKHEQLAGSPAAVAAMAVELARALEPALNDKATVEALVGNQELMSKWVDSPTIMSAVWNNKTATETLLESGVFRDELLKAKEGGGGRVGYVILLACHTAWVLFLAGDVACREMWNSDAARHELWKNQDACREMWNSYDTRHELWKNKDACREMWNSDAARHELWKNKDACREMWNSDAARHELWKNQDARQEMWKNKDARRGLWGNWDALKEMWADYRACWEVEKYDDARAELWQSQPACEALFNNLNARNILWNSPHLQKELWQSETACKELLNNDYARGLLFTGENQILGALNYPVICRVLIADPYMRKELWDSRFREPNPWESPTFLNEFAKNADAVKDSKLYSHWRHFCGCIIGRIQNSGGKFEKVEDLRGNTAAKLNAAAAKYPHSVIIATIAKNSEAKMFYKDGTVACDKDSFSFSDEPDNHYGVAFTGATFEVPENNWISIEIWQAK